MTQQYDLPPMHFMLKAYSKDTQDTIRAYAREAIEADRRQRIKSEQGKEISQFLTDVVAAAGLLAHGKKDKELARRIADGSDDLRHLMYYTNLCPNESSTRLEALWEAAQKKYKYTSSAYYEGQSDAYDMALRIIKETIPLTEKSNDKRL